MASNGAPAARPGEGWRETPRPQRPTTPHATNPKAARVRPTTHATPRPTNPPRQGRGAPHPGRPPVRGLARGSRGSAAADVAFSIGPFLANGRTGLLDDAARAAALTGGAAAHVMHGTAVPMASDAIAVAADAGGRLGSGWREGFAEGHTAVMQRRSPYGPADTTEAAYAQQPALYLPSSYAPLGAMANITYPCPTGPFGSIAPSGTIIGPGIPCGVPLLMVPREAVPTNALGQAVVRLTPTNPPVRHT